MLTSRQAELLRFIERYLAEHDGVAPSFDEMREAMGTRSKSGVHAFCRALEERGFIERLPDKARAIRVVRPADSQPLFSVTLSPGGEVALQGGERVRKAVAADRALALRIYTCVDAAVYPAAGTRRVA